MRPEDSDASSAFQNSKKPKSSLDSYGRIIYTDRGKKTIKKELCMYTHVKCTVREMIVSSKINVKKAGK